METIWRKYKANEVKKPAVNNQKYTVTNILENSKLAVFSSACVNDLKQISHCWIKQRKKSAHSEGTSLNVAISI